MYDVKTFLKYVPILCENFMFLRPLFSELREYNHNRLILTVLFDSVFQFFSHFL